MNAGALPSSSVEVNAIASHFKQPKTSKIFRHQEATLENVKESLSSEYNVLHFSCHGSANFQNPLETGLLTANNERLTVQHFFDAPLQARLVTLSACETGMIGTKQIEEVVGLPASLLQAGVAAVVSSLWSVSDLSTALLMIKFYQNFMQQPDNTAKALNEAQKWLREITNQTLYQWIMDQALPLDDTQMFLLRVEARNSPDAKPYQSCYHWGVFYTTGQ